MVSNPSSLYAILLAAGSATRFGATKQLAVLEKESLAKRAVKNAEAICDANTVTVLGHDATAVWQAMMPLRGFMVINEQHLEGIGKSIARGIGALPDTAAAALILLVDQPMVSATHLQQLIDEWQQAPDKIIASAYAKTLGPPAIFPRSYFDRLQELGGDKGARDLLRAEADNVLAVACAAAAQDIDTQDDLSALQND